MEKFGIFELLDALSAALEGENGETAPPSVQSPRTDDAAFSPPYARSPHAESAPSASRSTRTDDTQPAVRPPRTDDAAFSPPSYGEDGTNPALSAFIERHETIKKKIKK